VKANAPAGRTASLVMNVRLSVVIFALVASLAGCGGGGGASGGGVTPPSGGGGTATQYGTIAISVSVPAAPALARRPLYISPATRTMTIVDSSAGGSSTFHPACVSSVCTYSFTAQAGQHTLAVTLNDGTGDPLSTGTTTTTVVGGQTDTVQVSFDPIVRSMRVQYVSSPPGVAATVPVKIVALDADGFTIIGPGVFRDASGVPIVATVTVDDPSGHTSIGPGTIAGPDDTVALHYDGTPRTAVILKATATGSVPVGNASFVSLGIDTTSAYRGTGQPVAATIGSDGNIWMAGWASAGFDVVRLTPGNVQTVFNVPFYANVPPNPGMSISPHSIVSGADGNLWLPWTAGGPSNYVERVTTSGVATAFTDSSLNDPVGIAAGPDGNVWVTSQLGQSVSRVTPSGAIATHSLQIPTEPVFAQRSTFGPDGRLYFVNSASGEIDAYDIGTGAQSEYRLAGTTIGGNLVVGADGKIWFSGSGNAGGVVGSLSPSGTFTTIPIPLGGVATLALGPDGRIWFTDPLFGLRWVTSTGAIGGFPIALPVSGQFNVLIWDANGAFVFGNNDQRGAETLHSMTF
jgi:streptogramin lyase